MAKNKTTKMSKTAGGPKRAAIYVRVSSERQAEKVSPQAQEADCLKHCEQHGYTVIKVYKDTEKYKVGKRMVEPSGTRPDRPGIRAMLTDAAAGDFDIIVAWREDRLYRGLRPMFDVVDCIEQHDLDIELVKETFDRKMAGIKASISKMELDARHDRIMMGVAGRLASGKTWNSSVPYGYMVSGDTFAIDPKQSKAVRLIWEWYGDGKTKPQIRQRLIELGAKQIGRPSKFLWGINYIADILARECYHTGVYKMTWDGETYEIPIPVIVDAQTAQRVLKRKADYKKYPSGNLRAQVLAAGLVFCQACGVRMQVVSIKSGHNGDRYLYYKCGYCKDSIGADGCAKTVRTSKLDNYIWDRLWKKIQDPKEFNTAIAQKVQALQAQGMDAEAECNRIQRELDTLTMQRQTIITWGRTGTITKDDMEYQLGAIYIQEAGLKRELDDKSLLLGDRAKQLTELAEQYRQDVCDGAKLLMGEPKTEAERQEQFEFRRKLVQGLVLRVNVAFDKTISGEIEIDLARVSLDVLCNTDDLAK